MLKVLSEILDPQSDVPMAFFAEPGVEMPIWCAELQGSASESKGSKGHVVSPPFLLESENYSSFESHFSCLYKVEKSDFELILSQKDLKPFRAQFKINETQKVMFYEELNLLKNQFELSILNKAVPYAFAQTDSLAPSRSEQLQMLQSCLTQQKISGGYIYGLLNPSTGILGLTPELLYKKKQNTFYTMALAGTKNSSHLTTQDFLSDPKERKEHQLVIDGIVESLSGLGFVEVRETTIRESAGLTHLKTDITLSGSGIDAQILLSRLHPTAALGGHPKTEALSWLKQFDLKNPRFRFGAPFVFKDAESEVAVVAIRGIEWGPDFCRIGAGAGVVYESNAEKEWSEVQRKWTSIGRSLGLRIELL
jgi:isochorismate synthase EntC